MAEIDRPSPSFKDNSVKQWSPRTCIMAMKIISLSLGSFCHHASTARVGRDKLRSLLNSPVLSLSNTDRATLMRVMKRAA